MNKQTKQLLALGGLVLVAGIVAYFTVFNKSSETKAAGNQNVGAINATPAPTPGTAPGTAPRPGAATPSAPGQPAPIVQDQKLDMPKLVVFTPDENTYFEPKGGRRFVPDPRSGIFAPFDPLSVQNIDVVDPDRQANIKSLKEAWVLDGITVTEQKVPILDWTGKPMLGESITAPKVKTKTEFELDKDGNQVKDERGIPKSKEVPVLENGEPVYEQELDENGKPKFKDGEPVWVQEVLYIKLDREDRPELDTNGDPIVVRNPKPDDKVKRLVKQVPVMVRDYKKDEKTGIPILTPDGQLDWFEKPKTAMQQKMQDGKPVFEGGKPAMEEVPVTMDDTTPQTVVKFVLEAHFQGKRRTYRVKDRLTGTRFTIQDIFTERRYYNDDGTYHVRSGVDLISDTGAQLTLFMTDDSTYDAPETPKGK